MLGVTEDFTYQSDEIVLQKGETLFLYTDGVTEARNSDDTLFSDERLHQMLVRLKGKEITDFKGTFYWFFLLAGQYCATLLCYGGI